MPRKKAAADLPTLEQELARVQRQIRLAKSEAKKAARAEDARTKIIAGALALEHAGKNPASEFSRVMVGLLKEYVRENERHLFADLFRALLLPHEAAVLLGDVLPAPEPENSDSPALSPDDTEKAA